VSLDGPPVQGEVADKKTGLFREWWIKWLSKLQSSVNSLLNGGLTAGAGIAITGDWPNQTVTNTGGGSGSGITSLRGDATTPGTNPSSTVVTIANGAVTTAKVGNKQITYGKIQDTGANILLGQGSTPGTVQELQLGTNLSISGNTLNAAGGGGGGSTALGIVLSVTTIPVTY
jgi:hypothetical protein